MTGRGTDRPLQLDCQVLEADEVVRDAELVFYCRYVVSELKQFYPDEYEMLELLASGQVHDFSELAAHLEYTKHLKAYGLLGESSFGIPSVAIPVVGRYVAMELARREGRQTLLRVVPRVDRGEWISKRKRSILDDFRLLGRVTMSANLLPIFGANSFPCADQFSAITVVDTATDFAQFANVCNQCFVEAIENYGASFGKKKYYWEDVKQAYPGLWYALQRIKMYRHESMHLSLTKSASDGLLAYLNQDLEGHRPNALHDSYFILQQCVLDGLLTGIQIEIDRAS